MLHSPDDHIVRRTVVALLVSLVAGCAATAPAVAPETAGPLAHRSFDERCASPGVLRCFGFEPEELSDQGGPIHWGHARRPVGVFVNGKAPGANLRGRVELDREVAASGQASLKFFMPSQSGGGHAGQFYANFSDDLSAQFGEGDEFFIQWRQRFSPAFLSNVYTPHTTWKQVIIGEGSRSDFHARSCTQLELVMYNLQTRPALYHSCRGKDGRSEPVAQSKARYAADEWMTFQVRVKIGTWYRNDRRYHNDSLIEVWVSREGAPSQKVISRTYDLANTSADARYGKVWLLPYLTGKSAQQTHADAFTWYDELIVSTQRIPDPTERMNAAR